MKLSLWTVFLLFLCVDPTLSHVNAATAINIQPQQLVQDDGGGDDVVEDEGDPSSNPHFIVIGCPEGQYNNNGTCVECPLGFTTFGDNKNSVSDCIHDMTSIPTWYFQTLASLLVLIRVLTSFQWNGIISENLTEKTSPFVLGFIIVSGFLFLFISSPRSWDDEKTNTFHQISFAVGCFLNGITLLLALSDRQFQKNKAHFRNCVVSGLFTFLALYRGFLRRTGFAENDMVTIVVLFIAIQAQFSVYLDGFSVIGRRSKNWEMKQIGYTFIFLAGLSFGGMPLLFYFGSVGSPQAVEPKLIGNILVSLALFGLFSSSLALIAQFSGRLQTAHSKAVKAADDSFTAVIDVKAVADEVSCAKGERSSAIRRLKTALGNFFDQGRPAILCQWVGRVYRQYPERLRGFAFLMGRPTALDSKTCSKQDTRAVNYWGKQTPEFTCALFLPLVDDLVETTKQHHNTHNKISSLTSFLTEDYSQTWVLQLVVASGWYSAVFNIVRQGSLMGKKSSNASKRHVFYTIIALSCTCFVLLVTHVVRDIVSRNKSVSRFEANEDKTKFRGQAVTSQYVTNDNDELTQGDMDDEDQLDDQAHDDHDVDHHDP